MGNLLQDRRTATEWASVEQVIEITEKIGSFNDLAEIVESDLAVLEADKMPTRWRNNVVAGRLQFGFVDDDNRIPKATGRLSADVDAVCQRCLQPFRLQLHVEPQLLLLQPEDTVEGYEEFEVWELGQRTLRPKDIVEELLIMALPFSAMHDRKAECKAFSRENAEAGKVTRPFSALRSIMQDEIQQNGTDSD